MTHVTDEEHRCCHSAGAGKALMKIVRRGQAVWLGTILAEVFERAERLAARPLAEARQKGQTALYVASLVDARGFALATEVHRVEPTGPDPAKLRERSRALGAVEPLLVGSAPVETLASALESLGGAEPPDRHLLAWTVREIHRSGGVPVVMLTDGVGLVTTLDTMAHADDELELWAWSRAAIGDA